MNKKPTQIVISLAIVLSIGGFLMRRFGNNNRNTDSYFGATHQYSQNSNATKQVVDRSSPPDGSSNRQVGQEIYKNDTYGFSLIIPESMKASELEDEVGKTILIKDGEYEMQIYVSNFDENIILTAERIKQDIPDIKMKDVYKVKAGGITAITFIDTNQNTREVWFVNRGFLYQVSSRPEDDEVTGAIMQSWRWD